LAAEGNCVTYPPMKGRPMVKSDRKNVPLILITRPLIVYEITFALFVIYYIQQGTTWFTISSGAILLAAITALVNILIGYRKLNVAWNNKKYFIILAVNFLFFALYLFCFLVQVNKGRVQVLPHFFFIPLLFIPPFVFFIMFLFAESRHSAISREDQ
jgi:hypothetical protein